jgi:hypothetical protein
MTPQTVAVRPIPAIAAVGSIETAPAENAHMPNAAEVITNFAEYIAFSKTGGGQHAGRGLTIELKGHSAQ